MELEFIAITQFGFLARNPKPLVDSQRDICEAMASMYKQFGYVEPWTGYMVMSQGEWVGTCAFKTPPQENRVEIAYHTFADFQGKGVATQMAKGLIAIAEKADPSIVVTAQTLPEKNASNSILRKLGFTFIGHLTHPEDGLVWEFELPKPVPLEEQTR